MSSKSQGQMPAGVWYAHLFQVFNTMSYVIVIGTPMILFFKKLGASATILGLVVALNPLLNILQIPAAKFLDRIGYRAFVLKGWSTRSFFIIGMAAIAFLPASITPGWRMVLMLILSAAFNAARGVSACGFLPWLTQLIPDQIRGKFLSRDQMANALALCGTFIITAVYLVHNDNQYAFGIMFVGSYIAALVSLSFLRRIPDVPVVGSTTARGGKVPWMEMLFHPPFWRLMVYNSVISVSLAAAPIFWIPLLRDWHGVKDGEILGMQALASGVGAVTLLTFGRVIDHVGSRPILGLTGLIFVLHFATWAAVSAGWLPFNMTVILLAQTTLGIGNALFNLGNTRLVMSTVPVMGRSHFFALFSMITNVILGALPIIWGLGLDAVADWRIQSGGWTWNRYSMLYTALAAVTLMAQWLIQHLQEPRAMTTDAFLQELVFRTPAKALSRLIGRRPF